MRTGHWHICHISLYYSHHLDIPLKISHAHSFSLYFSHYILFFRTMGTRFEAFNFEYLAEFNNPLS